MMTAQRPNTMHLAARPRSFVSPVFFTPPRVPPSVEAFLHSLPLPTLPGKPRSNPSTPTAPPPDAFRIHAWRWHHLAIEAHLHALSTAANPSPAALTFLSAYNWDLHDRVEALHLTPLVTPHASPQTLRALARTRARLSRARAGLRADLPTLPPKDARRRLGALCGAAAEAFAASEAALVPAVAGSVPLAEQDRFNSRVVRALGRGHARVALIMFYDALFAGEDGGRGEGVGRVGCGGVSRVAPEDRQRFRIAIPRGIRVLLPMWRRGFARKHPDIFLDL